MYDGRLAAHRSDAFGLNGTPAPAVHQPKENKGTMRIRPALFVFMGALLGAPAAANAQAPVEVIRVQVAPPAPQVEVIPVAPSAQHVWISGHWRWDGARYVWNGGHWDLRRDGYVWSPAHWVQEPSGSWIFRSGQWVAYGPGGGVQPGVTVQTAPPPPQVEVIPVAPSPAHSWVPGHWTWNGARYIWIGGHWRAARQGYYWVPSHWQRTPGGYVFIEGHYRAY